MSDLYFMVTIANRARLPEIISLYRDVSININMIALGRGTATGEMLNYFGLDRPEKAVCFSVVTGEVWRAAKKGLEYKVHIDVPGTGIAFIIPMSSIGGKRELAFLTEGQGFEKGEEHTMKGTAHELLVVISDPGYNEAVMNAARESGAAGGTVLHARGTGMKNAEKFLGVSLASEKEIIFIVTKTSQKNAIMGSIMRKAGIGTKANAIAFSLPVSGMAGLRLLEESEPDAVGKGGESDAREG
ncbi:transcriptional regulator [Synergistes jonesii]|uniref:Nitrogen regulatory protein P-II n=1 Tax=Synergistes jonesii TaxID=2754 RepID=A0A073IRT1_9BACT|nr:transcriptional regulator [Synergistes jonesii]KEJ92285.1 nitrogen regulatory protein P-II [Synergistes jonesii]